MPVFTVFLCGTGSKRSDVTNKSYWAGETVSTLASHMAGREYVDWLIVDGPGSGNEMEEEKWSNPERAWGVTGTAFGRGWVSNVEHALAVMKLKVTRSPGEIGHQKSQMLKDSYVRAGLGPEAPVEEYECGIGDDAKTYLRTPITVTPQLLNEGKTKIARNAIFGRGNTMPTCVNMLGWSRGGVSCFMLANLMGKDPVLKNVPVNIFAIDPVPGPMNFRSAQTALGTNVKNYFGVYARDELSEGFSPVIPQTSAQMTILPFPGRHATLSGNAFCDGAGSGAQRLAPPGMVVRHLAEKFLVSHGSALGQCLNFNDVALLRLYEQMMFQDGLYRSMRDKSYLSLNVLGYNFLSLKRTSNWFASGGERVVGVGRDWTSTGFSEATSKGSGHGKFINTHHAAIWGRVMGNKDALSQLSEHQRQIAASVPTTRMAVYGA
jgi:hypothetical protein